MSINSFNELLPHYGHTIVCVVYGDQEDPANIALECETCNDVLLDFDNDEEREELET